MRFQKIHALLVILALLLSGSVFLNLVLYRLLRQYYIELNGVRLDPIGLREYPLHADSHSSTQADQLRVVFFGDSRSAGWLAPAVSGYEFINRGLPSQTSVQAIQRFHYHVRPLQPDVIVIQIGINDLKTIPLFPNQRNLIIARCQANIRQMLDDAKQWGTIAIITTIFPVGEVPLERKAIWSSDIAQAVQEVNAYIQTLADEQALVLDTAPLLADGQGLLLRQYRRDELHLNSQGYGVLNQALLPYLERVTRYY